MSLDNIFEKARDIFEAAYRKTENVVTNQKQKFDIHSLELKLNKNYEVLGKAYFGLLKKGEEVNPDSLKPIIDEITQLTYAIDLAKEELMKNQNKSRCKKCGQFIDDNATYCNKCGEKVE